MNGNIVSARRGSRTQHENQFVVKVDGCDNKAAAYGHVGKTVLLRISRKKQYSGRVTVAHGTRGAMLANFGEGLPGQFVGKRVEVG